MELSSTVLNHGGLYCTLCGRQYLTAEDHCVICGGRLKPQEVKKKYDPQNVVTNQWNTELKSCTEIT
jgi:hypothetical protein